MGAPARWLVVLAGGSGSRIGGEKAMRELAGRPLIDHVLEAGRAAKLELAVVAKADTSLPLDLAERGVRVMVEPDSPQHPLHGVCWALDELAEPIVVVACDMPFVSAELLQQLASDRGRLVVAPVLDGHLQPTLARYEPGALASLREDLSAGAPARDALERVGVLRLAPDELAQGASLGAQARDIDTADELSAARAQSPSRAASSPGVETGSLQEKS